MMVGIVQVGTDGTNRRVGEGTRAQSGRTSSACQYCCRNRLGGLGQRARAPACDWSVGEEAAVRTVGRPLREPRLFGLLQPGVCPGTGGPKTPLYR